jgi:hypothetical protein
MDLLSSDRCAEGMLDWRERMLDCRAHTYRRAQCWQQKFHSGFVGKSRQLRLTCTARTPAAFLHTSRVASRIPHPAKHTRSNIRSNMRFNVRFNIRSTVSFLRESVRCWGLRSWLRSHKLLSRILVAHILAANLVHDRSVATASPASPEYQRWIQKMGQKPTNADRSPPLRTSTREGGKTNPNAGNKRPVGKKRPMKGGGRYSPFEQPYPG